MKIDTVRLKDPFLSKSIKLIPCQRDMVKYWHNSGTSIHGLARMFKVTRSTIQSILYPERLERQRQLERERGRNYDKENSRQIAQRHRQYKRKLIEQGLN